MNLLGLHAWQQFAIVVGAMLVVACFRVLPFREKKSKEPERTVGAAVVSKEVKRGTQHSGRSKGGFSYTITFATEDGRELELFAYEEEFGRLQEGMKGTLTYKGRYFVAFQ